MAEYMLPGYGYIDETGSGQFILPGYGYVDESVAVGVSGIVAYVNANDACAASGSSGSSVSGASATTNANDAPAASGTTTVVGSLSRTNANDTSAASGTTTVIGTVAYANANDVAAASGVAGAITGSVSHTNQNDIGLAFGTGPSNQVSGGFFEIPRVGRRRSVKEDRERLGIIPREVKQVIKAVARASVAADKTDGQAEAQLTRRLEQQDIEAKAKYTEFMRVERDRLRTRDIARSVQIQKRKQWLEEDDRDIEMLLM